MCEATAASEPSTETYREQSVDNRVQAGVEKTEDEEDVGEGVRDLSLQVVGEKPVPQAQQVVGSPAHYEAYHDDDTHFQGSHPRLGDVVL